MSQNSTPGNRKRRAILAGLAAILALAGVYGIIALQGNSSDARAKDASGISRDLAAGPMKRLIIKSTREDRSGLVLYDADGKAHKLGEWKGRVLLVNFWATWCFPCRKEMPEIGALQKAFDKKDFLVIAASEDRKGYQWAKEGINVLGGENLTLMMDTGSKALRAIGERGLPTTILIDRQGREFARLIGPAAWASEEAKAVIRAAIAEK